MDLTVAIPFRDGHTTLPALLGSLPAEIPVVVVDDGSTAPLQLNRPNTRILRANRRLYFAGAVNAAMKVTQGDVLVLNQDITLGGDAWRQWLAQAQLGTAGKGVAIAGHAQMRHPHWPRGYVQGQFMWLDRLAWEDVGPFNERDFPLWGCTAEWQLRAVRRGWQAVPTAEIPGMTHARPKNVSYGSSIQAALEQEPAKKDLFIRTPPLVSVIVTSQSYGRYLTDCVHSLVGGPTSLGEMPGQTFQAFEIVIVDDGSTDETHEVGLALADDWKAIRYIRRETKGGTPAANNTGISRARGRFITIVCGDDMREPDGLENLYRVVERNPRAVPYDDFTVVENGRRTRAWPMSGYSFDRLLVKNMMHAGIMFEKRGWEKAGGYPEVMVDGREDWAFNVALGRVGYCGVHVERAGYLYRREGQNRSLTNQGEAWRAHFMEQMHRLFPGLYAGERPMSCCGGSNVSAAQNESGAQAQSSPEMGAEGMTLMEYLGFNAGTESYYSRDGRRQYVFGGSRKKGFVDNRDVQTLLDIIEGRRQTFQIAEDAPAAPAPSATPSEPLLEVIGDGPEVTTLEAAPSVTITGPASEAVVTNESTGEELEPDHPSHADGTPELDAEREATEDMTQDPVEAVEPEPEPAKPAKPARASRKKAK